MNKAYQHRLTVMTFVGALSLCTTDGFTIPDADIVVALLSSQEEKTP